MSEFKIQMPKLGESVQEATITKWFVKEGDRIEEDEPLFEVATDKVDSEIPSPVDGVVKKIVYQVNALVPVGETVAIISIEGDDEEPVQETEKEILKSEPEKVAVQETKEPVYENPDLSTVSKPDSGEEVSASGRFYSPLVYPLPMLKK